MTIGWKWLASGIVIGFLAGGALILSRQPRSTDTDITFPNKSFNVLSRDSESAKLIGAEDRLDFSGTLTGSGVGYPNNLFHAVCIKQSAGCHVSTVNQIGSKLIGELNMDDWQILEWSPDYVVARSDDPATTLFCSVATFHANLHTQEILYTLEPVERNMANEKLCPPKFVDGRSYRWAIEAPNFWNNLGASKQ